MFSIARRSQNFYLHIPIAVSKFFAYILKADLLAIGKNDLIDLSLSLLLTRFGN
ncbi:hypothetical protein H6G04_30380 [Calothrix membranacea FACHB-236]|nr:hypothetical protein [Calothrix membranacea FACHB-236]